MAKAFGGRLVGRPESGTAIRELDIAGRDVADRRLNILYCI